MNEASPSSLSRAGQELVNDQPGAPELAPERVSIEELTMDAWARRVAPAPLGDEPLNLGEGESAPIPLSPDAIEATLQESRDAQAAGLGVYRNSARSAPLDPLLLILILAGAALVCALAGVLASPLLAPLLERVTGVEVKNTADLRPMGGVLGLLFGLFIGAMAAWVGNRS